MKDLVSLEVDFIQSANNVSLTRMSYQLIGLRGHH
jgi:hypothetical protein